MRRFIDRLSRNLRQKAKLIAVLISVIATVDAAAQGPRVNSGDIVTSDCSPVVLGTAGNTHIEINCSVSGQNAPKFRITYYRVDRIGLSFLLNGLLSPEWEKRLGGQQAIIPNDVFREAKKYLDLFGVPLQKYQHEGLEAELSFQDDPEPTSVAAYLSRLKAQSSDPEKVQSIFNEAKVVDAVKPLADYPFPDLDALLDLYERAKWPQNYNVFYEENFKSVKLPRFWRYVTPDDLSGYKSNLIGYMENGARHGWGPEFDSAAIEKTVNKLDFLESISYLTRNGYPEKFMIARDGYFPCGSFRFEFMKRKFQLVIAVLENTDTKSFSVGNFHFRKINEKKIRTHEEAKAELDDASPVERRLYPPGVLREGEKIVIPVRIELADVDHGGQTESAIQTRTKEKLERSRKLESELRQSGEQTINLQIESDDPSGDFIKLDRAKMPASSVPEIVPRFEYGPAWRIDSVMVDDRKFSFRQHNPNNFVLIATLAVGC